MFSLKRVLLILWDKIKNQIIVRPKFDEKNWVRMIPSTNIKKIKTHCTFIISKDTIYGPLLLKVLTNGWKLQIIIKCQSGTYNMYYVSEIKYLHVSIQRSSRAIKFRTRKLRTLPFAPIYKMSILFYLCNR